MARVDPNSTLGGVRGSVAGMVVSSGLSGWNARTAVTPLRSRSYAQAQQRSRLAAIGYAWRNLSAPVRADWATAAALDDWKRLDWFGVPYSMGGFGLFVALNMPLRFVGASLVSSPPAASFPAPIDITAGHLYRDGTDVEGRITLESVQPSGVAYYRIWLAVAALGSSAPLASRRSLDVCAARSASSTLAFWVRAANTYAYPLIAQTWTVFYAPFDSSGRSAPVTSFPVYCTPSP